MRNVPPGIRIMSAVLTPGASPISPVPRKRGCASVNACSLMRRCYARMGHNRVGPWSNKFPSEGGQNARGDRGTGRWGDCRPAHHEADITMDVLAWDFLPIRRLCRLDRGPIHGTAAWLPRIFAKQRMAPKVFCSQAFLPPPQIGRAHV